MSTVSAERLRVITPSHLNPYGVLAYKRTIAGRALGQEIVDIVSKNKDSLSRKKEELWKALNKKHYTCSCCSGKRTFAFFGAKRRIMF